MNPNGPDEYGEVVGNHQAKRIAAEEYNANYEAHMAAIERQHDIMRVSAGGLPMSRGRMKKLGIIRGKDYSKAAA